MQSFNEIFASIPEADFLECLVAVNKFTDRVTGETVGLMYRTRTLNNDEISFIVSSEALKCARQDSVSLIQSLILPEVKVEVNTDVSGNKYILKEADCLERRNSIYDYAPFEVDMQTFILVNGGKYNLSSRLPMDSSYAVSEAVALISSR